VLLMRVLVVNAGSSSIKLALVDADDRVVDREHLPDWSGDTEALRGFLERAEFDVVGHRVVHGGWHLTRSVRIDDEVEELLRQATPLAPLHQPRALAGIDAVRELLPACPEVACFDTSFHAELPAASFTYALPAQWRNDYGIRRFGFHGLNHSYVAGRVAEVLGRDRAELRTVSAHLGAGASLCAIAGGRSVDTTMGFTPLEGLVMATRAGSIDPGIVTWLAGERGMPLDELLDGLQRKSGLQGLSGISGNLAKVQQASEEGNEDADLAVGVYLHRLVGSIAAMAAAMGGMDALVFTAGVGENAAWLRSEVGRRLGFLGVAVDEAVNATAAPDADITRTGAPVHTLVIAAREDLQVARETRAVLGR
jgi:acetate kinase